MWGMICSGYLGAEGAFSFAFCCTSQLGAPSLGCTSGFTSPGSWRRHPHQTGPQSGGLPPPAQPEHLQSIPGRWKWYNLQLVLNLAVSDEISDIQIVTLTAPPHGIGKAEGGQGEHFT